MVAIVLMFHSFSLILHFPGRGRRCSICCMDAPHVPPPSARRRRPMPRPQHVLARRLMSWWPLSCPGCCFGKEGGEWLHPRVTRERMVLVGTLRLDGRVSDLDGRAKMRRVPSRPSPCITLAPLQCARVRRL